MSSYRRLLSSLLCFFFYTHCLLHSVAASSNVQPRELASKALEDDFHWECSSDEECSAIGSKCIEEKCECSAGHIFNSDMTSCLKVARKLGEQCTEDIQCSRLLLSGGRCINNACNCAEGYYYLKGRCNPHSELFGRCKKDGDCYVHADFEASACDNGTCKCSPGYYQREYRTCRRSSKEIGDFCVVNADCHFDEKAYCNKNLECARDESSAGESSSHNRLPRELKAKSNDGAARLVGGKCEKDEECKSLGEAVCISDGTCACKRGHFPSKKQDQCVPELGETCSKNDAAVIKNSVCRNDRWACEGTSIVSADRQKCRKASRKVGESCQGDEQCSALGPDAYCNARRCECNKNSHYVESEEFCWANKAHGERCEKDLDCYVNGFDGSLYCISEECSCPNGTRLHASGLKCVTSSADIGMSCDYDSDCAADNAVCLDDVCACADNHYQIDGQCLPGINATCTSDDNCTPQHSRCLSGRCSCQERFVASAVDKCLPVVEYGKVCLEDVQCEAANSHCRPNRKMYESENDDATDKVCACIEGYYFKLGKCFPRKVLGEACSSRDDCYLVSNIERAICLNGFCTCNWGFSPGNLTVCNKARTLQPYRGSAVGLFGGDLSQMVLLMALLITSVLC